MHSPAHSPSLAAILPFVFSYRIVISHCFDLLVVICPGQLGQTFWIELPTVRKELCTVFFGELRAKGVDGDNEGSSVSLKLQGRAEKILLAKKGSRREGSSICRSNSCSSQSSFGP